MSQLHEILKNRIGKGAFGGRRKGSADPFSCPERDLAHAWRPIFKQAVVAAQIKYIENEDKEALEVLDTISHMMIRLYAEAYHDNLKGLQLFAQLYDYLEEKGQVAQDVYAEFCAFVVQTLMCYLFTVQEMTIGLPPTIGEATDEFTGILNILSSLSPELRKQVVNELYDNGTFPRKIDCGPLLRDLDNYIEVIEADQARRYAEMEERENADG